MGMVRPFRHGAWRAAPGLIVLATIFALLAAPVALALTHGPAPQEFAAAATMAPLQEAAAHAHAHGPSENDHQRGSHGGHGPTDHDHQFHALISHAAGAQKPHSDPARSAVRDLYRHLTPEGPRRPPRRV